MFPKSLRNYVKDVTLSIGDMIVDTVSGQIGLLVACDRRISMTDDDIYFWHVKWSDGPAVDVTQVINPIWMEEEGLKLSILVGFYNLHVS